MSNLQIQMPTQKFILLSVLLSVLYFSGLYSQSRPVQTVTISGQNFLVHQVNEKETLYSISKKYDISWSELLKINRLDTLNPIIRPNDLLFIPLAAKTEPAKKEMKAGSAPAPEPLHFTHEVKPGDNWYAIARLYGISPATLKSLNPAASDTLRPGDELKVTVMLDQKAIFNPSQEGKKPVETRKKEVTQPATTTSNEPALQSSLENEFKKYSASGQKTMKFRGIASWLHTENDQTGEQFLALSNQISAGKLVKVTNLMNQQSVYVKIIGKIPEGRENKDLLIKLSGDAARKLDVLDQHFLVELITLSSPD